MPLIFLGEADPDLKDMESRLEAELRADTLRGLERRDSVCMCLYEIVSIVGMMCHCLLDLKSVGARLAYFNISQVVKVQLSSPYV